MATIPDIWLCICCTSSFDAGPPARQPAVAGCPRCKSPRIQWSIPAAYYLAAGGTLAAAFAIAELERQRMNACFYRHHCGDISLLELTLNLASEENPTLTRPSTLRHRLRLHPKYLTQCVN